MTELARVFERLTSDQEFADEIRRDPAKALREFDLDAHELTRLERALGLSIRPLGRE